MWSHYLTFKPLDCWIAPGHWQVQQLFADSSSGWWCILDCEAHEKFCGDGWMLGLYVIVSPIQSNQSLLLQMPVNWTASCDWCLVNKRDRERECGIWKPVDHPAPSMLQLAWLSTWIDCGEYGLWHVLRALGLRDWIWSQKWGVISPQAFLIKSPEWQLGFERARLWKKAGCFWKSLILLNVNVCQVIMI